MIQRMEMHEFDRLYGEYKPRFILIACSYLRDRSAAEDLVTDCFMHFWEKREEIVPVTENIPAYILGMVRHKCIDALRTRQQHLMTQQQIYQLEMRSIREIWPLLRSVIWPRFSSAARSRRFFIGDWPKCRNSRPRYSSQIGSRIRPIRRLLNAMASRFGRLPVKFNAA